MAKVCWDQVNFTRGELDPRVRVRTDWQNYYKAAKKVRNCVCIPQGGVTRRWGTEFVNFTITQNADYFNNIEISTFAYNDNIIYLTVWENLTATIYLENVLVDSVKTIYQYADIPNLKFSTVQGRLIITDGNHIPQQLVRTSDVAKPISGFQAGQNVLLCQNLYYGSGKILPVKFAGTTLPATVPVIFPNRDYFIKAINSDIGAFKIYATSEDAARNINAFSITSSGVSATIIVDNTWTIKPIDIINYPTYDFTTVNYLSNDVTFKVSITPATSNTTATATITCSGATPFIASTANDKGHIGGMFSGNGGVVRITAVTSSTIATGIIINPFSNATNNTTAIAGDQCFLAEVAWSDVKGWPRCSTFFQGRMVFAGSALIPNGQWLSVIYNAWDFDDSETNPDNAINSYPSSGNVNYIQSVTSARSLLVHTNTANYSTPIQNEQALTPQNYMLSEHNKFGVGTVAPVYMDNQLFFIDGSGNNVITMAWDFIQGNYVTNSVSIAASSLIRYPVDMAAFAEPKYLDGFYILFVNADGTLAILQTLKEEDILAFSLADTNSYIATSSNPAAATTVKGIYKKVTSAKNRAWFLVQRTFVVNGAQVQKLCIEEIDFDYYTDCSITLTSTVATTTFTSDSINYLNGQVVEVVSVDANGNQYVLQDRIITNNSITIEVPATTLKIGLAYVSMFVPLSPVVPEQPGMLFNPTHIRTIYISYYNTKGATIQGYGIPTQSIEATTIGAPSITSEGSGAGVFTYSPMEGWSGAIDNDLEIIQDQPLPMTITGISYILDISK